MFQDCEPMGAASGAVHIPHQRPPSTLSPSVVSEHDVGWGILGIDGAEWSPVERLLNFCFSNNLHVLIATHINHSSHP